jgi:hypothetical protein
MSRVLVIGSDNQVSREIGDALSAASFPMEYSAGDADGLQRLRMRSYRSRNYQPRQRCR